MKKITVLGPNPAMQKTLFFERFNYGNISRAKSMEIFPAGKGINFCRAGRCHGRSDYELIEFTGGENGAYVKRELAKEGMHCRNIHTVNPTRCCITCLCQSTGTMSEVIEPSYPASAAEVAAMMTALNESLQTADGAAFCGTVPTGTDKTLYLQAAELVHAAKLPLLLDSYMGVEPIFNCGVEIYLKINREELFMLTECGDLATAFVKIFRYDNIRLVAITDGPGNAYLADRRQIFSYTLPKLDRVVNPIGCGDTASSIWMSEILNGTGPEIAFQTALAAASANCLSAFPGSYDLADADRIKANITLTTVKHW